MSCYLVHLSAPMSQGIDPRTGKERLARHYIGYAQYVDQRFEHHCKGTGAHMLKVAVDRGIELVLARVWSGSEFDKSFERKLKNQKHSARLCPICNPVEE